MTGQAVSRGSSSPSERQRGFPYVVATSALTRRLDLAPLGDPIAEDHRFDPTRLSAARFLDRIERLDAVRYSALGMKSPRWALYDCAELPGAIAGYGRRACDLAPEQRAALEVEERDPELCPVSMVVATPMLDAGRWLIYAMAAIDGRLEAALATATAALRAQRITVTTQWASGDLDVLAGLGAASVLAAWLPAHDHPATCVLDIEVGEAHCAPSSRAGGRRRHAAGSTVAPREETVDPCDERALERLQRDIEAGARVRIVGPRTCAGAAALIPIARVEPA